MAVTIASAHCAYPRRDGQAEMAWVAGYVMRQFTCPKAVTHISTNRARCRATALIKTNAIPLHQTATIVREAATICPRPCKLTFDILTLKVVFELRDVGYLCANFSLPRPLYSRLRQIGRAHV